ncbi:uncharacterized protein LOC134765859 [Penaeus indicus]|uniref:uncharacterized protein LOC134765859 n=1 Tax=Penaeus indicus TaxID=29960 RepID=UPI00300CF4CE
MVQSRYQLVTLVKETEQVFSPILQCYFATTIVVICTELYLLAQRLGSRHYEADEVIVLILLTLQTTSLFVMVSLAAGGVQDEAGVGGEILRRGLPFDACDRDKYHAWELTRSLSITPVYITGGNFFTINRAFILTVVSAVASYFIVILQFMNTCQDDPVYNASHVG